MGNTHSSLGIGIGGWLVAAVAAPFTGGSSFAVAAAVAGSGTLVAGTVGFAANAAANQSGTMKDLQSGIPNGIVLPLLIASASGKRDQLFPSSESTSKQQPKTQPRSTVPEAAQAAKPKSSGPGCTASVSSSAVPGSSESKTLASGVKHKTYAIYDPAKKSVTMASTRTVERCEPVRADNGLQKCATASSTTYTDTNGNLLKTREESGTVYRNTRTGTSQSLVTGSSLDVTSPNPRTAAQVHLASTVNRNYPLDAVPVTVKAVKSESSLLDGHINVSTTSTGYSTRTELSISKTTANVAAAAAAAIVTKKVTSRTPNDATVTRLVPHPAR